MASVQVNRSPDGRYAPAWRGEHPGGFHALQEPADAALADLKAVVGRRWPKARYVAVRMRDGAWKAEEITAADGSTVALPSAEVLQLVDELDEAGGVERHAVPRPNSRHCAWIDLAG